MMARVNYCKDGKREDIRRKMSLKMRMRKIRRRKMKRRRKRIGGTRRRRRAK